MKRFILLYSIILLSSFIIPVDRVCSDKTGIMEMYSNIPLAFTANHGQNDPDIKFTCKGSGCSMFFSPDGVTFLLENKKEGPKAGKKSLNALAMEDGLSNKMSGEVSHENFSLKQRFIHANPNPEITGEDRLPWNNNYFIGNDPDKWQTDVPNYRTIRLHSLYKGIDLVYYGNNKSIKYDFMVKPGAYPSQIMIAYDPGDNNDASLSVNHAGDLVIATPLGEIIEQKPYCYQIMDSQKNEVEISYKILDEDPLIYTYYIDSYNPEYSLIIDPQIVYSTFIGGSDREYETVLAVDGYGNAYIAAKTLSSDFPTTSGAYERNYNNYEDVVISKLNSSGSALEYSTYLGSRGEDWVYEIVVDDS